MKIRIEPLVFVLLVVCLFEINCHPAKKGTPKKNTKTVIKCQSTTVSLRKIYNQVVIKAARYSQLLSNAQIKELNQQAKVCNFNQFITEQDHMPPKSAVIDAYKAKPKVALAKALYGSGSEGNMLAMSYKKGDHRIAGTTGSGKGVRAVTNLIQAAIEKNDPFLTYKYSVLATNTAECVTTAKRDFTNYMNAYINRLKGGSWPNGWENKIRNWTTKLKGNKLLNDSDYDKLEDAFFKGELTKNFKKLIC